MKIYKALTRFIFLIPILSWAADTLYIGYDAGETNIFAELLKEDSTFLALGTAVKVAKEKDLNPRIEFPCPSQNRSYEFSLSEIDEIEKRCGHPEIVVTGLYSTPQKQLAKYFKEKGAIVIGYWDNFSSLDKLPQDLTANMSDFASIADHLITPSQDIADDLNARFDIRTAAALGQPTLEAWEKKVGTINTKMVFEKLGFSQDKPLLVYIGGYGADYAEAFNIFLEGIKEKGDSLNLFVHLHPKVDGKFEKELLNSFANNHPLFPSFHVSESKEIDVYEAAAMSSLIATHKSTVGIQALFAGKKTLYIDVPETAYTNFAIEKNLSKQVFTAKDAALAVEKALKDPSASVDEIYEKSGIPRNAAQNFQRFLLDVQRLH